MPLICKIKLICHPVWEYLNQPILGNYRNSEWHPNRFWYLYKIELLERCWQKELNSENQYHQ